MSCESFGGGQDRRGRSPCWPTFQSRFRGGPTGSQPTQKRRPDSPGTALHSVGAAYLCEEHCLFERRGRRLELKATPDPGRLVIV